MFGASVQRLIMLVTLFVEAATTKYMIIGNHIDIAHANPRFVRNSSFSTKLLNRTARTYSVEVWLQPNVTLETAYLRQSTFYKIQNSYRQLALLNFETDVCAVFAGNASSIVFGREDLSTLSNNLIGGCPFKESVYVRQFVINTNSFANYIPYLPTGQWRLDSGVYTKTSNKWTHIFSLRWFFDAQLK